MSRSLLSLLIGLLGCVLSAEVDPRITDHLKQYKNGIIYITFKAADSVVKKDESEDVLTYILKEYNKVKDFLKAQRKSGHPSIRMIGVAGSLVVQNVDQKLVDKLSKVPEIKDIGLDDAGFDLTEMFIRYGE